MSLSKSIRRARASTKSLLGDRWKDEVTEDPGVPTPPKDISASAAGRKRDVERAVVAVGRVPCEDPLDTWVHKVGIYRRRLGYTPALLGRVEP